MKIEEQDLCILCGGETGYARSVPVDMREHYVDGAGQLCPECDALVYEKERGAESSRPA